jgi:hypothetical protein
MDRFSCDDDVSFPKDGTTITPTVSCNESLAGMYFIADCDETVDDNGDDSNPTLRFDNVAEKRGTGSTTASTTSAIGNDINSQLNHHYAVVTPPSKDLYRMEQEVLAKQLGRGPTHSGTTKRSIQSPQRTKHVTKSDHAPKVVSYQDGKVKANVEKVEDMQRTTDNIPNELQLLEHDLDVKTRHSKKLKESRRSRSILDDIEAKKLANSRPFIITDEITRLDVRIAAMNSKVRLASKRNVQQPDKNNIELESTDTPVISNVITHENYPGTNILKREGSTMVEHCHHPKIDTDKDEATSLSAMYQGMNTGVENTSYGLIPNSDHNNNSNQDLEYGVYENEPNHKGLAIAFAVNDEEEDMYIPSAVEFDPDAKPPTYKNRRFRFYACLAILVVIVGTITASVGATLTQGTDSAPEEDIPYRATLGIRESIERIVGSEKLDDMNSPYRKALDWVQDKDPLALGPDTANFIQRYLAVYFFYATSIKQPWSGGCNPPINGENDTCIYTRLASLDPVSYTAIPWNRWLSKEFECSWAGIYCDDGGQIRSMEFSTYYYYYYY